MAHNSETEYMTLNDGTVVDGHVMDNGDGITIFVYLDGMDIIQGVMLFSDPDVVSTITAMSYGVEHVYHGYTQIWSASAEFGNCNLTMRKGGNNA